jgi:6-phosphofructokinase 1
MDAGRLFHEPLCLWTFCFVQGFRSVLTMAEHREKYPEFCIPMTVIPATINNDVPGTDFSLGADTSINEISEVRAFYRQHVNLTNSLLLL